MFFGNGFVEFLYATDPEALGTAAVARTGLGPRFRPGGCPLGIVLRAAGGPPPFPTWSYRPAYFPPGVILLVATSSVVATEPLIAVLHVEAPAAAARPAGLPPGRHDPRRIRSLLFTGPWPHPPSTAVRALAAVPEVAVDVAPAWHVAVGLTDATPAHVLDLAPDAALSLSW